MISPTKRDCLVVTSSCCELFSALLQANSEAFYSRAYLQEETVDNYRTLPGIKFKTKISNVTFGQVLQAENCGWNASTDDLASVEVDVCGLSAMAEICQFQLEQSFVSLQMTKGSNGDFTVASSSPHRKRRSRISNSHCVNVPSKNGLWVRFR